VSVGSDPNPVITHQEIERPARGRPETFVFCPQIPARDEADVALCGSFYLGLLAFSVVPAIDLILRSLQIFRIVRIEPP
jgi:hypothetical protein